MATEGGKVRRKAARKIQSTPYDRPAAAAEAVNGSWVSKLVHTFFFRTPQQADQESRGTRQETAILSTAEDQRPTFNDSSKQCLLEDQGLEMKDNGKQLTTNGGFSELELMLKQKTFTRSEIDRLTEVLHSRTVESSGGDGDRSTGFRIQETVSASRGQDRFSRSSLHETRNESDLNNGRFAERVPVAAVSSEVFEDDVATPAELAKAYMGNMSSKVSPSMLGLRTQSIREDSVALCNSPFAPRSPVMSLVQKPSIHGGVLENGFMTPRSQGRSAIYSMARTPYSRNRPTATHKGSSSIYNGYGGPSASPSTGFGRELVSRPVSKDLALKRRSSVLEDEIGSVGPIRRLRQKTILSTPKNSSLPVVRTPFSGRGTGKAANGMDPSSSSKTFQGSDDRNVPGKSYTPVPSQSTETARKIFLQLEKMTRKEKQDMVGTLSEDSPSKVIPDMTERHALRSLEDVDPPKLLQADGYGLNSTQKGLLPDACETSSSRKQDKVEENGQKRSNVSHGSSAPAGTVSGTLKYKYTVPPFSFSESVNKQVVTQPSQKKWGFQMTAQEDLLDLDDKIQSSEAAAFAKLAEKKNILETTVLDSKAVPVSEEKTSVSEYKEPAVSSEFSKPSYLGTHDGTNVAGNNSGLLLSAAPAASTSLPPVVSVSPSTTFTKIVTDKEPNAPSPPLKIDDKISPFTSSSFPFVSGSFSLKPNSPTEVKQDTTNSLAANASDVTETVPKPTESKNSGAENSRKTEDTAQVTSAPINSFFTFSSKPSVSSLNNGSLNSTTPSVFPSTAAFSAATPSTSATSSSLLAPAAFNFVFTSNSTPSATPTPSLPPNPDFKSGFSFMPPSVVSTTSFATDLKASNEKEPSIANLPSSGTSVSTQSVSAFATSATPSTFASSVSTPFTTGSSLCNSSISSGPVFGNTAFGSFAIPNNSTSSGSMFNSSAAGSSPFGLSNSVPSSAVFSFSAQTPAFGPSTGATSSTSPFAFSSAVQTQPLFSMPGGNNGDQDTMADDSMAEDVVQVASTPVLSPTPSFPAFNQPSVSNYLPNGTSMFPSTFPSSSSGATLFQFNGQQSQPIAQNPTPFEQSGSGGFSVGSGGGGDKSGRRIVKVKRRNGKK